MKIRYKRNISPTCYENSRGHQGERRVTKDGYIEILQEVLNE
jgi:hypothetical protein